MECNQSTTACTENTKSQVCGYNNMSSNRIDVATHNSELLEFSEPITDLQDLEADIYDPDSVIEVLTLAHVHYVPFDRR